MVCRWWPSRDLGFLRQSPALLGCPVHLWWAYLWINVSERTLCFFLRVSHYLTHSRFPCMPKIDGLLTARRHRWQVRPFLFSFLIHAVVFVIHVGACQFPVVSGVQSFFVLQWATKVLRHIALLGYLRLISPLNSRIQSPPQKHRWISCHLPTFGCRMCHPWDL